VKSGKKHRLTRNVYDLALDRLRLCFDRFDKVVVSFSGGKDSTACVQLALQVAREAGRLPLDVYTFDEEAIPPETVDYMARVATNPDIRFHWYCLPVEHRNACSRTSPVWWPWAPEARSLWVRDLPPLAITELAGFRRQPIPEVSRLIWGPQFGTVCIVMGIRTQESLSRYHACPISENSCRLKG
jgi:predicted phosphoadenosine phosphosulfate sulfurtransferase